MWQNCWRNIEALEINIVFQFVIYAPTRKKIKFGFLKHRYMAWLNRYSVVFSTFVGSLKAIVHFWLRVLAHVRWSFWYNFVRIWVKEVSFYVPPISSDEKLPVGNDEASAVRIKSLFRKMKSQMYISQMQNHLMEKLSRWCNHQGKYLTQISNADVLFRVVVEKKNVAMSIFSNILPCRRLNTQWFCINLI